MSASLLESCPWRPPDWRWLRAQRVESGEDPAPPPQRDRWLHRAVAFIRRMRDSATLDETRTMLAADQDLFWAHQLSTDPNLDGMRADFEARLLVPETQATIAGRVGFTIGAVQAYESYFFDVRDRLSMHTFIVSQVIGTQIHRNVSATDFRMLWRYFAFTYGSRMLDLMVNQTDNPTRPNSSESLRMAMREDVAWTFLRKQVLAVRAAPLNSLTALEFLELARKMEQGDAGGGGNGGAGQASPLEEGMAEVLRLMPITIGPFAAPRIPSARVLEYDASSSELNTTDLVRALDDPTALPEPSNLRYPEPNANVNVHDANAGSAAPAERREP